MSHSKENLVLHLKLDEIIFDADQKTVVDVSGKVNNGQIQGEPQLVTDETFGSCLSFDGTGDYLSCDNINIANSSFTIELWAKQESATQPGGFVLGQGPNQSNKGLHLGFRPNQKFTFAFFANDLNTPAYTDTDWHHYACVYDYDSNSDKGSRVIYRDGEKVAEDRDRSPYQGIGELFIGHSLVFNSFFSGQIAPVRIYNKALSLAEIQQDMEGDLTAIASFNKTHPLDFNLYEGEDKEPVIFIENGTKGQELTLEIVNNSDQPINLIPKSDAVSATNHHFELRFRPDTLSPDSLQQLVVAGKEGWSMSSPVTQADSKVSLYFLATNNQALGAKETIPLTLQHINGAAAGGARTTRVELRCPEFTYKEEPFSNYYREQTLSIVSHRGKKNIPLHVGFVGSNRILNDGSSNELILRITNVLKDKSIPFNPASKGDEASKLIISFDIDSDWALGTKSQVESITIEGKDWRPNEQPEEDWNIVKGNEGETPIWTITHQNEEEAGLVPGQVVQLTIKEIISSLPSGHTNLYVRYENIPGYWDGTFICTIEKSPILYKEGNVGIGTSNTENNKLKVQGNTAIAGRLYVDNDHLSVNNGCIGIGSLDFSREPLVIRARERQESLIAFEDPNGQKKWHIEQNHGGNTPGLNFVETGVADFRFFIQKGGNVGIGTKTANYKLEVNGDISVGNFVGNESEQKGYGSKLYFNGISLNTDPLWIARYNINIQPNQTALRINLGDDKAGDKLQVGCIYYKDDQWHTAFEVDASGEVKANGNVLNGSSKELKENIVELSTDEALEALEGLNPIKFSYKADSKKETNIGFIAEDVPELVASSDRKYLSSMDIVAVLTQVMKQQQQTISELQEKINILEEKTKV